MRRRSGWVLGAAATLVVSLAIVACRDATEPFRPTDREPAGGEALRLTYSSADDRAPAWSAAGDSVYFTTSQWEENPLAPRTVVSLPVDGMGSLTTLLLNVQAGNARANWIGAAAPGPHADHVAFVRVLPMLAEEPCFGSRICPAFWWLPMVRLTAAEIHARPLDSSQGLQDDAILTLEFPGHSLRADSTVPTGVVTLSDYHPFQFQFEEEGRAFFRPSWSPDGIELVVSDGLRLLRWTPGSAMVDTIPGTADGITPAWSPTGEWIAYTRHERLSSLTFTCEYRNMYSQPPAPPTYVTDCVEERTMYETAPPQVVLVRPDGSEERILVQGVDPAWSPDGRTLYVGDAAGTGSIARVSLDDGSVVMVPNTTDGIEPAVSPDGSRLAFARATDATHDIWVVELP